MVEKTFQQDNVGRIRTFQGARFLFVVLIYMSHCVTPNTVQPFDFGGEIGVAFLVAVAMAGMLHYGFVKPVGNAINSKIPRS